MVGCMSSLCFKGFLLQSGLAFVHWCNKQAGGQVDQWQKNFADRPLDEIAGVCQLNW